MTAIFQNEEKSLSAIGDSLITAYHLKTLADTNEILYYSREGVYKRGADKIIERTVREQVNKNISHHDMSEIIYYVKTRTYTERQEFDKDPDILNLKNGLINIKTGEFSPHKAEYPSLVQMPVNYDPRSACPQIAKFLKETLDPEQVKVVVKMLGYILLKSSKYEKAFLLVGEGSNGKSVLIKLIIRFVGPENTSQVSLQELTSDRFASAHLFGKMVNAFADLKADRINDSGYFKLLVSGDRIRAQKKHQQPFDFENYAKLIFSANKIPETQDDSFAYFRRWVILRFDRTFEGPAKDENFIEKMTTSEELSGLLNVALGGLRRLRAEHGFEHTDIDEIREMYQEGASRIRDFINEQCTLDTTNPELTVTTYSLHTAYASFCKSNGTTYLDMSRFGEELKALGVEHKRKRKKGSREYIYEGIALKRPSVLCQNLSSFTSIITEQKSELLARDTRPESKEAF